jgi:hypothetical protein
VKLSKLNLVWQQGIFQREAPVARLDLVSG